MQIISIFCFFFHNFVVVIIIIVIAQQQELNVLREIQTDAHKLLPSVPSVLNDFVDRGARGEARFLEQERKLDRFGAALHVPRQRTIANVVRSRRLSHRGRAVVASESSGISASARTKPPTADIRLPLTNDTRRNGSTSIIAFEVKNY